MRKFKFVIILLFGFFYGELFSFGQDVDTNILKEACSTSGWDYRCDKEVKIVNHLRHLGKEKALKILNEYVEQSDQNSITLVCWLLFVNPKGWDNSFFGSPFPEINQETKKQFPLFPLALSDNVPFLVVEGYSFGGWRPGPEGLLKKCESLSLITADLSNTNFEAAARTLIQSKAFQQLYKDPKIQQREAKMILGQAGVTNFVATNSVK